MAAHKGLTLVILSGEADREPKIGQLNPAVHIDQNVCAEHMGVAASGAQGSCASRGCDPTLRS